ncbi:hypothetical protein [Bradyrhizobium centrosematis]|nr:hypothetical protein [Bradyrhizobium centrosematis]MCS3763116.1 hypothetical protein [Bradyrhizobium centrosematis]MCS3775783.1 hypothetical protein [Bradyrhizobium centrosematis]
MAKTIVERPAHEDGGIGQGDRLALTEQVLEKTLLLLLGWPFNTA